MRAHRFRPSFDVLALRITPSGGGPTGAFMATPLLVHTLSGPGTMPGDRTTLDDGDLDDPSCPIDLDQPPVDPTQWTNAQ